MGAARAADEAGRAAVLVVDDDLSTRVLLSEILGRLGSPAEVAADGADALGLIGRKDYRLLVVDLRMPHVTGSELLHVLPTTPSRRAHRIVFTAVPEQAEKLVSSGFCCAALPKPFDLKRFLDSADRCLRGDHAPPPCEAAASGVTPARPSAAP